MRLAFVSTMEGTAWGGSEELWSQAAACTASLGHSVFASVKYWQACPQSVRSLQKRGVEVQFRMEAGGSLWRRLMVTATSPAAWSRQRWERRRWLKRIRPDLVCVSDGAIGGASPWMRDCLDLHIPYVSLGQANFEGWWPSDSAAVELREVFGKARRCFFVSNTNKQLFECQIGCPLENAEVVWNPFSVPWDASPAWPNPDQIGPTLSLACIGRLDPSAKGQDLLLNVLGLPRWMGRDLRVTFYGKGSAETCLRTLASKLGVSQKVQFVGHVADIADAWKMHHALILPSRFEGLPLAVVEAMLCNRPVIATSVAGIPEVVEDNVSGFLAAAPTVPLMDEALQRAWAKRSEWNEIGTHAGKMIRKLVPQDPGQVFADILLRLASDGQHSVEAV